MLRLAYSLQQTQQSVHEALLDSFDTPLVLRSLINLCNTTTSYLKSKSWTSSVRPNVTVLRRIGEYMTRILTIFGVISRSGSDEIGFPLSTNDGFNPETVVLPVAKALAQFRDSVRQIARENKTVSLLQLCDALRDEILPELGIRIEDGEGSSSAVKLVDKEELMREKQREKEVYMGAKWTLYIYIYIAIRFDTHV